MNRRNFLQKAALASLAAGVLPATANAFVPAHNWDGYDFGNGPIITNRLNQGPFPSYLPEVVVPGAELWHGFNHLPLRRSRACQQKTEEDGALLLRRNI